MELKNFSVETHQGPFLNVNEDAYDFDLDHEIFMIFDGYGGSGIGDKVVDQLKKDVKNFYFNFVKDKNSTLPFYYSSKYLPEGNALINAAMFSHEKLYKENMNRDFSKRGGASGILMAKNESLLTLLFVGNCRGYLLRRGKLISLCREDSHRFISKDTFNSYLKNMPLSGFGLFPDIHYQLKEVRIIPEDKILLMSDGVYGRLDDEEVSSSISKYTINIKQKVLELFDLANQRGNLDNQTCMILEY